MSCHKQRIARGKNPTKSECNSLGCRLLNFLVTVWILQTVPFLHCSQYSGPRELGHPLIQKSAAHLVLFCPHGTVLWSCLLLLWITAVSCLGWCFCRPLGCGYWTGDMFTLLKLSGNTCRCSPGLEFLGYIQPGGDSHWSSSKDSKTW